MFVTEDSFCVKDLCHSEQWDCVKVHKYSCVQVHSKAWGVIIVKNAVISQNQLCSLLANSSPCVKELVH